MHVVMREEDILYFKFLFFFFLFGILVQNFQIPTIYFKIS